MKKFIKLAALASAVIMLVASVTGCGSSSNEIVFGTDANFPPFEFVSESGIIDTYDGIDIAIARQIGDDMGKKAQIADMNFDSLLDALQDGKIDAAIAAISVTDDRAETVDFSIPYYNATQVIIVKEGSDITCAADLADKLTAVVSDYTGETWIKERGYSYKSFSNGTECINAMMVAGICDAVIIDSATAGKYVADYAGLAIVSDDVTFGSEQYAIAVKAGNTELLNQINDTIKRMLDDGTIANISDQYCVAE